MMKKTSLITMNATNCFDLFLNYFKNVIKKGYIFNSSICILIQILDRGKYHYYKPQYTYLDLYFSNYRNIENFHGNIKLFQNFYLFKHLLSINISYRVFFL